MAYISPVNVAPAPSTFSAVITGDADAIVEGLLKSLQ